MEALITQPADANSGASERAEAAIGERPDVDSWDGQAWGSGKQESTPWILSDSIWRMGQG